MNFKFFPQTKEEIEQMLKQAGMNSLDDLYADCLSRFASVVNTICPSR